MYKKVDKEGLINGLDNRDRKVKGQVKGVWEYLKQWCKKTQKKYYTGIHDSTYQNFSSWCLSKLTIKEVLEKEGFSSEKDWSKKVEAYKNGKENFIKLEKKDSPKEVDKDSIEKWCEEKGKGEFKHEAFGEYSKVKKWCFINPKEDSNVIKEKRGG